MMKRRMMIWVKVFAVVVFTVLFFLLIYTDETKLQLTQPKGAPAEKEEVIILVKELAKAGVVPKMPEEYEAILKHLEDSVKEEGEKYISYEEYYKIWKAVIGETQHEEEKELFKTISFKDKYKKEFWVLREDWYQSYEAVLEYYGLQEIIQEKKVSLLGGAENLQGEITINEREILNAEGEIYTYLSDEFRELSGCVVRAYVREDRLLTCIEVLEETFSLNNVWVMVSSDEGIRFFYKGYELYEKWNSFKTEGVTEQVATLTIGGGGIKEIEIKNNKISGKILRMDDIELEIEGYGTYSFADDCKGYRLYETLREATIGDLAIGYDFADFVVDDGEICSFLLVKKEQMESIRVLIKNSDFASLYHQEIEVCCEEEMILTYGAYDNRKQEIIGPGDVLTFGKDSDYLQGEQVRLEPLSHTGRIEVLSVKRNQGIPSYRGVLEISLSEDGLVLVNEVLLEEYLYSVVPSEMPASYPIEALKAQAVCARTYAYGYLLASGLGGLGAHVDDSTAYQVYNNIAENINSTKAVKETDGEILLYDGNPVNAYYYSTSCGYGSDERVWSGEPEKELPYLQALYLGETEGKMPEELSEEENFKAYITKMDENAFEKTEVWHRWNYKEQELKAEDLYQRMLERYQSVPEKIRTYIGEEALLQKAEGNADEERIRELLKKASDETFSGTVKPEKFKEIYEIFSLQRLPGGVMNELCIVTDKGTYKVMSEYNIRYILNTGSEILRQDGSGYKGGSLLPSAYFVIETNKDDKGRVIGFELFGGGYGHGVGMSQNGAKNMAVSGYEAKDILAFFFRDCVIEEQY